jgi:hypothetical protein
MARFCEVALLLLVFLPDCAIAQDKAVAAANPYADPGVQNFVETAYGYRRQNIPDVITFTTSQYPQPPSDLRDSMSNSAPSPELEAKLRELAMHSQTEEQPQPAKPRKSARQQEEELLVKLNSPELVAAAPSELNSVPKYQLYDIDYRIRSSAGAGPLTVAVPPLGEASCPMPAPQFAVVFVHSTQAMPLSKAVASLSASAGFKPYVPDVTSATGDIAVRGWADSPGLAAMAKNPLALRIISGLPAQQYLRGITAPPSDVMITLRVPQDTAPYDFLKLALVRLNDGAGFVWQRTVAAKVTQLADGSGIPGYLITVEGQMPADAVQRAAQYPFVTKIDAADLSHAGS